MTLSVAPRDAGSGFAARVLAYLEAAGYPFAPRYLGVDDRGLLRQHEALLLAALR